MDELDLLDWKRRVFALYAAVRAEADAARAVAAWRAGRDKLFARHPQSPIAAERRGAFAGLSYFPFDPAARVSADVVAAERQRFEVPASVGEPMAFTRFAVARFPLGEVDCELELYWLDAYGGGLFVPFADTTSGDETYGAGRYLLDTVKGADLGTEDGRLVLDFNLAYNPSCSYDPRWACPLAPPANRLPIAVRAGERHVASPTPHEQRLRSLYEAFNARDVERCLAGMTPDVDWENGWEGGRVVGRDAVRDYWRRQWAAIDSTAEPTAVSERPDGTIEVGVHLVAHDREGNLLNDGHARHVYAFRGDLVARMTIED